MFTGIIEGIGEVVAITTHGNGRRFTLQLPANFPSDMKIDDSIAINGVCQTITSCDLCQNQVQFESVEVTLQKTTLGQLTRGEHVNLELATKASARLGGHIVTGHVNGVGLLRAQRQLSMATLFEIELPADLTRYVVNEGAITVDGVSLTVAKIQERMMTLSLIPHTLLKTTLGHRRIGDRLNLEVDILAKYLEKLIAGTPKNFPYTQEWLTTHGF